MFRIIYVLWFGPVGPVLHVKLQSNPESVIFCDCFHSPVNKDQAPIRAPRRKKGKRKANTYEGPEESVPPGVPVIPRAKRPGPRKSIRLPAAGAAPKR